MAIERWSETDICPPAAKKAAQRLQNGSSDLITLMSCLRELSDHSFQLGLLFDEIDSAILDAGSSTAAIIREVVTEGHLVIVAASFSDPSQLSVDGSFASPWWNVFRLHNVGLFEVDEARELLLVQSEKSGRIFSDDECNFLLHLFGSFPYFLQQAGFTLFFNGFSTCPSYKRDEFMTISAADTAREISWHLNYAVTHLPTNHLRILQSIAHGKRPAEDGGCKQLFEQGFLVKRNEHFSPYSLCFAEYLKQLPEASFFEKLKTSQTLSTVSSILLKALEEGSKKAIDAAAGHYLGGS